jgi:malate dehydrogenase (oxaloacetate-decarboxylating)(NADP+)
MSAAEVQRFGMPPKLAFLPHSNFASSSRPAAQRTRSVQALFRARAQAGVESDSETPGRAAPASPAGGARRH